MDLECIFESRAHQDSQDTVQLQYLVSLEFLEQTEHLVSQVLQAEILDSLDILD